MSEHLCSGASICPDCNPEVWASGIGESYSGGVTHEVASRIAEAILAEEVTPVPTSATHRNPHLGRWDRPRGIF